MKPDIILLVVILAGSTKYILSKENVNFIDTLINTTIMLHDTVKKPTVFLEKVVLPPMSVLFISDTAGMTGLRSCLNFMFSN